MLLTNYNFIVSLSLMCTVVQLFKHTFFSSVIPIKLNSQHSNCVIKLFSFFSPFNQLPDETIVLIYLSCFYLFPVFFACRIATMNPPKMLSNHTRRLHTCVYPIKVIFSYYQKKRNLKVIIKFLDIMDGH